MSRAGGPNDVAKARVVVEGDIGPLKKAMEEGRQETQKGSDDMADNLSGVGEQIDANTEGARKFTGAVSGLIGTFTGLIGAGTAAIGIIVGLQKVVDRLAFELRSGEENAKDLFETLKSEPEAAASNLDVLRKRADDIKRTISDLQNQPLESPLLRVLLGLPGARSLDLISRGLGIEKLEEELAEIEPEIRSITQQVEAQREAAERRAEAASKEQVIVRSLATLEAARDAAVQSRETAEERIRRVQEATASLVEEISEQNRDDADERIDRAESAKEAIIGAIREEVEAKKRADEEVEENRKRLEEERREREETARREREQRELESIRRTARAFADTIERTLQDIAANQTGVFGTSGGSTSSALNNARLGQLVANTRRRTPYEATGFVGPRRGGL